MSTTLLRLLLIAGLGLTSTFAVTGCERDAGDRVEDAADDVGDAVDDAADDVKDAAD